MKLNFSSAIEIFGSKRLELATKTHNPLGVMELFCQTEGSIKICVWNREPLDTIGRCARTAYIEHKTFLDYLKQTQSSSSIFSIANDVILGSRFGLTIHNFLFPNLIEAIDRLYATGIPEQIQKQESNIHASDSRRTLHIAGDSKIFSWYNCAIGFKTCDPNAIDVDRKGIRKRYLQKKGEARDKRIHNIHGFGTPVFQGQDTFRPVPLVGNISSLFGLISLLLLFSVLTFWFEMLTNMAMKRVRIFVLRSQILYHVFLSTTKAGFNRMVQLDSWSCLRVGCCFNKIKVQLKRET